MMQTTGSIYHLHLGLCTLHQLLEFVPDMRHLKPKLIPYNAILMNSKYSHGIIINTIYGRKGLPSVPKAAETVSKMKPRHNSDGIRSSLSLTASSFGAANLVLIILTTLVTSSEAQSSSGSFSVLIPIVAVSVVGCVFFIICICVCATICYATSRATQSNTNTRTVWQQRNQLPPGRPVPAGGLSYPVQRQRHSAQISRAPGQAYPSSNTVPEEPVSLPEATLHHGDAPPGYEEAIRMKTVDGRVVTS